MRPYTYAVADSVSAATSRTGATFLAGGTTLVDLMKLEVLTPEQVVDINSLPLTGITVDGTGLRIGALEELGVAFVELARAAGVRRFVFSSVIHPSLGLQNHAAKAPVEAALYDSGMEYAVFQPALFFQNYAAGWDDILRTGVLAEPWSNETRFSRVDYRDVADAVALALTEDRLVGGTYEVASVGQLDRHDVAELISRVVGRPIRPRRVDPDQLDGIKPAMKAMFRHYDHAGLVSTDVTLTAVLGRPPRTLEAYFRELARRGYPDGTNTHEKESHDERT